MKTRAKRQNFLFVHFCPYTMDFCGNIKTLSNEEEQELILSNKKIKDVQHTDFSQPTNGFEGAKGAELVQPRQSIKDKLVGVIPGAYSQAFDLSKRMEEDLGIEAEGRDIQKLREGLVAISIPKTIKQ